MFCRRNDILIAKKGESRRPWSEENLSERDFKKEKTRCGGDIRPPRVRETVNYR